MHTRCTHHGLQNHSPSDHLCNELRTRSTHVCFSTHLKTQPAASYGPFFCCPMPSSMAFFCHTTPFFGSPESQIMGQTAVCPRNNPTALCLSHTRTNKQPPFPSKNILSFSSDALAHLPAPVDYVRPTQTHKPTRPSNKPKIDPTPGNPQTMRHKTRPHMTPHSPFEPFSGHGASTLADSCWLLPTHPHTHAKPTAEQSGNKTNPRKPT